MLDIMEKKIAHEHHGQLIFLNIFLFEFFNQCAQNLNKDKNNTVYTVNFYLGAILHPREFTFSIGTFHFTKAKKYQKYQVEAEFFYFEKAITTAWFSLKYHNTWKL